jgi:Tfp pilus assembly protein PilZ
MQHIERRACERFEIFGATASYRGEGVFASKDFSVDSFPVIDLSLGGLRLLTDEYFKIDKRVSLKILIPGEEDPLLIRGTVRWVSINPEKSYKYQAGIQFNPYGKKKGENPPGILERLRAMEKRHKKSG